jgi:hypothetical protein
MGYFNRFLLFIYSLAIAAVSLGIVALCLHVLPMNEILNEIKFALSRWETIAAAVFVFFFSVHILGCALSSGSSEGSTRGEMLLLSGVTGAVSVSVEASVSVDASVSVAVSVDVCVSDDAGAAPQPQPTRSDAAIATLRNVLTSFLFILFPSLLRNF